MHTPDSSRKRRITRMLVATALVIALCQFVLAESHAAMQGKREQLISILGVTLEEINHEMRPVGTVAHLIVSFEERTDNSGLILQFRATPGKFSPMAQTSIQQAIYRASGAAGLDASSWTVVMSVPYPGVTIYGDSLSAMVGLSVVALARGEFIPPDRVITGSVSPDGHILPVGSISLKVDAANLAHIRRVLVPDELDIADNEWRTPFLMHVSPVSSLSQAYFALTDRPLRR